MWLSEKTGGTVPIIDWWRIRGIGPLGAAALRGLALPDYAHYPLYPEHLHSLHNFTYIYYPRSFITATIFLFSMLVRNNIFLVRWGDVPQQYC